MLKLNKFRISYTVSIIYLFFGLLWIYITDSLMLQIAGDDTELLTNLQNYKGWAFVLISALLLFGITELLVSSLSKSNNRYKTLFDNNPMPTWICDTETGAILDVNQAAIEQYGYLLPETKNTQFSVSWSTQKLVIKNTQFHSKVNVILLCLFCQK